MQGLVNSAKAVVSSRATWQTNVAADIDERAKHKRHSCPAFARSLLVAFGGSIDVLADFGLAPPKARTPLTPAEGEKQAAAAKGKGDAGRASHHGREAKRRKITGATAASLPSGDATKAPATSPATTPAASPAGSGGGARHDLAHVTRRYVRVRSCAAPGPPFTGGAGRWERMWSARSR